jgi:ApbE superfamily uncharacterized protein (UPF0280 family)
MRASGLYGTEIAVKETDLSIFTDRPLNKEFVYERIQEYRQHIEEYIRRDRRFLTALKPIAVELGGMKIVKEMAGAARKAGVGPMAAVAGAIAQSLGKDLLREGFREVIVENGGDIFLATRKVRTIGIYSGRLSSWRALGIKVSPGDSPVGICASSGTIGHSLSFGSADSVVIIAGDTALADAVATATANRVRGPADLEGALRFARAVRGVRAAVIILKKQLASWGKIEFTRIAVPCRHNSGQRRFLVDKYKFQGAKKP